MDLDTPRPLDEARSQEVAAQISSKPDQPFAGAHQGLAQLEGADYVQGFLVIAGDPFGPREHAWLETEAAIIDPAIAHAKPPLGARHYFPAQRLSSKALNRAIETAREDYPEDDPLPVYGEAPYAYYGDVMLGGEAYERAYQQAQVFNQLLMQQGAQS